MKLLAVFTPLALAANIPDVPKDWPASLDVRAKLGTWTKLDITIENKSPKAFNILKAGSILDENRLESMRIRGKVCSVGFVNSWTPPHTNPRDESEFQLMPAYGKITTTIDLLDVRNTFRFCGNETSVLFIRATIHAAEVGSTTLVHDIPYELDSALIYHEFFPPLPEAFEERVHKCSPDYLSVLKEGITGCASQARAAREAALNGSAERMEAYFKDSSRETRNSVADTFDKAARDIEYGLYASTTLDKDASLENADSYALFSDAVYLKEDGLNQTRADAQRESIRKTYYDSNKLGNMTRSEFLRASDTGHVAARADARSCSFSYTNILGDFAGGGATLFQGILLALLARATTNRGQVVEANMVDGSSYLATFPCMACATPMGDKPRGQDVPDGGCPWPSWTISCGNLGLADRPVDVYGHSWGGMLAAEWAVGASSSNLRRLIISSSLASMAAWRVGITALRNKMPEAERAVFDKADKTGIYEKQDWTIVPRLYKITVPTLLIDDSDDEAQDVAMQPFFDMIRHVNGIRAMTFLPGSPPRNTGTHIGMFLAWAHYQQFLGPELKPKDKFFDGPLNCVSKRLLTGCDYLPPTTTTTTTTPDVIGSSSYLDGYERTLAAGLPSINHIDGAWGKYDLLAPVVNAAVQRWRVRAWRAEEEHRWTVILPLNWRSHVMYVVG
ncbi:hypothetical protein MY11210_007764 [Beauveria gryllotalpidicola]